MGTIKTFALLIGLTLISVQSAEWYKEGPIYQIYPAAFADSDGDGMGDLRGIAAHADYLKDIGIGAVWLSPVFESPMKDNGYDVKNYTVVSSLFGSMEDMENLIATFHERGIKVLLDFVPNHTSDESTWFKDSVKKMNGKENWYVWKDPKGKDAKGNPVPPNNWRSKFGVGLSAWTYVPERGQYYFHQFGDYQPDLNYEHSEVLTAVKESLRFWLGKGIDGFRMDAVPFIGETSYGSDEPLICTPDNGTYECLDHIYTMNQEVTYKVLNAFDEVLREPQFTKQGARVMFVESYNPLKEQLTYYGNVSYPFNFQYILNIRNDSDAYAFQNCTMEFLNNLGGRWPNWVVGNHDNSRVGSRMGPAMIDTMNILTLLLPGVAITYNGEELGMTDGLIRSSQRRDFGLDRDPERTPMQWNATRNAGFTQSNKPYLPANPNYYSVNVEAEKNVSTSHLNIYKKAVKLHKQYIDTTLEQMNFTAVSKWVFGFHRPGLVVITNLNNKEENVTVKDFKFATPDSIAVALSTPYTNLAEGAKVSVTDKLILHPRGTIVLQYGQKSSGAERTAFSIFIMFACLYFTLGKN